MKKRRKIGKNMVILMDQEVSNIRLIGNYSFLFCLIGKRVMVFNTSA